MIELALQQGDWIADKSLSELRLPDEGVLILAVQRADGRFVGAPQTATVVAVGDTLYLYGRSGVVADLDDRPDSPRGDIAHEQAVAEQEHLLERPVEDPPAQ